MPEPIQTSVRPRSLMALWIGILAGPLAWAADEVIGYTATAHECSTGQMLLLHSLTVGALLVCGAGFFSAWGVSQSSTPSGHANSARHQQLLEAMKIGGMVFSVGFAMVIVATAIPKWILSACD